MGNQTGFLYFLRLVGAGVESYTPTFVWKLIRIFVISIKVEV
jgi:hypothetical protein